MLNSGKVLNTPPPGYRTPPFPSLYWPVRARSAYYLYDETDIWLFTLLWTLIVYGAVFVAASTYAVFMQRKNWKIAWIIPLLFSFIGGIEAMLAGSITGLILAAIYNAGYFKMSTWIPFVWGLINALTVILSSFAMQGGL